MPDLGFQVAGVDPVARGLTPLLHFRLKVTNSPADETIHSVILQAQIQIQAPQRTYSAREKERLEELFGTPDRWGRTLKNKLWTQTNTCLRAFSEATEALLPVACTFDLNIGSTKYFCGLEGGEVPLLFLFSGTVFYAGEAGNLQVQQIPWSKECAYRMPVQAWRSLMDYHYPGTGWLELNRDLLDRLSAYKRRRGFATWDQAFGELLLAANEKLEAPP